MRHQWFLALILMFGVIGAIRVNAPDPFEDMVSFHVNVRNEGAKNLEDLKVKVLVYDLDTMLQANTFDLKKGDSYAKLILWNAKDVKPGTYLARISVSNDKTRQVKHRYVTVG